jgi:hypothetical protein
MPTCVLVCNAHHFETPLLVDKLIQLLSAYVPILNNLVYFSHIFKLLNSGPLFIVHALVLLLYIADLHPPR